MIDQTEKKLKELAAERELAGRTVKSIAHKLVKAKKQYRAAIKAQKIIQATAQEVQQKAHERIAAVVSKCLKAVFDDPYEFKIVFEQKRGKTEARLVFVRDGKELDPTSAAGGGVVDVAAFALRLACLVLRRPPLRRILILDEPFKFLSSDYRDRVGEMLVAVSEEMDVQIIMVTHSDELRIGKVIHIS